MYYLLNFDHYKSSLPASIRDDLNPLYELISAKQQKAQQNWQKNCAQPNIYPHCPEWNNTLKNRPSKNVELNAKLTIKQLADRRL